MEIQQENNIVRLVYEEALRQQKRISEILSHVEDEELGDELNQLLVDWRRFGKKAKQRLAENHEMSHESLSPYDNRDLQIDRMIDEYIIKSEEPQSNLLKSESTDIGITRAEIMRTEQMAERTKYMIHENKRAGVFATELAKELIDFEELSVKKLKNYL